MGSSIDTSHIESLLTDIKTACEKLVEHGLESLVVMVGSDIHYLSGSETGKNFLSARNHFIADFQEYCKEKSSSYWANKRFSASEVKQKKTQGDLDGQEGSNFMDEDTDEFDAESQGLNMSELDGWIGKVIKTEKEPEKNSKHKKSKVKMKRKKTHSKKAEGQSFKKVPVAVKQEPKPSEDVADVKVLVYTGENDDYNDVVNDDEASVDAENYKFECSICGKMVKTSLDLADHVGNEHEKAPEEGEFPCSQCGFLFVHEAHLLEHNIRNPDCVLDVGTKKGSEKRSTGLNFEVNIKGHASGGVKKVKLKKILNIPKSDLPVECPFCHKKFDKIYAYQSHILTHQKFNLRKCHICLRQLNISSSMPRHLAIHEERPYFCGTCYGRFLNKSRQDHHVKYSCKKTKYRPGLICSECGYQTKSMSHLTLHKKKHTHVQNKCELCGKLFKSMENYTRHIANLHKTPFQCTVCGKTFKKKDTLKRHEKDHGELNFKCEICGKPWSELGKLKRHMKIHSGVKLYPFVCEICGQAFTRKTTLDAHRLLHTGETPFKCDFEGCTKAFRSISSLKQHKEYHVSYSPFMCDLCGRSFKRECLMKHHRKSHTEYQWPCDYCGAKYNGRKRFKTHILTHHLDKVPDVEQRTKLKFFKCHICLKVLSQSHVFKEHMAIHKGLKPNKCSYCGKGFSTRSNMRQHERTHTGGKKLRCNLCSKTYNDPKALEAHCKNRHQEKMDGPVKDGPVKARSKTQDIRTVPGPELQPPPLSLPMFSNEERGVETSHHLDMIPSDRPLDLISNRQIDLMSSDRSQGLMSSDRPLGLMSTDRPLDMMASERPLDLMPSDRPLDLMSPERAMHYSLPQQTPHPISQPQPQPQSSHTQPMSSHPQPPHPQTQLPLSQPQPLHTQPQSLHSQPQPLHSQPHPLLSLPPHSQPQSHPPVSQPPNPHSQPQHSSSTHQIISHFQTLLYQ